MSGVGIFLGRFVKTLIIILGVLTVFLECGRISNFIFVAFAEIAHSDGFLTITVI